MVTPLLVAPSLNFLFIGLSVVKITQLFLFWAAQKTKKKNKVEYSASVAPVFFFLDLIAAGEHQNVSNVPRKKLRAITDPMLKVYLHRSSQRPPQRFSSLREASEHFTLEFTGDDHPYLTHLASQSSEVYLRLPLGIVSLLAMLHFCLGACYLLIREVIWKGGNGITLLTKIAAGSTLSVVYIVSCAENISFEEGLTKYPWLEGVFSSKQPHPMIGRAVCPLYRRQIAFPKDVMDFTHELVPVPSGTLELREIFAPFWRQLWHRLLPCHVVAILLALWIIVMEAHDSNVLQRLAFSFSTFYAVRTVADRMMGIEWHKSYSYYP